MILHKAFQTQAKQSRSDKVASHTQGKITSTVPCGSIKSYVLWFLIVVK
jgi:hypothetical protein